MSEKTISKTEALGSKVVYAAFTILKENGGEMRGKEVIKIIENRVQFEESEREILEKTGNIRWMSILHFYTIDCSKAGYLVKKKGIWYLTPEGEKSMALGPVAMLKSATEKYRMWKRQASVASEKSVPEDPSNEEVEVREREMALDEIESLALDGIIKGINAKTPYEFQDLAAALLRAMGYFTPFVAPRGKDGGVDIMAYRDPLGTQSPRIKVQVKHRESTTPVQDIRQLMGLLQKDDVGIFFSTGGFTSEAKSTARGSHVHVELIDLDRFIELWRQFYEKLSDEDKAILPLTPVYFISPNN